MTRLADLSLPAATLAAARRGERAARHEIYDRLASGVMSLALRVVGRTAAEDVFQATLMRVYEQLDAFRGDAPFGRWVRAIALNQCRMHLRSPWQRARQYVDELQPEPEPASAGADEPRGAVPGGPGAALATSASSPGALDSEIDLERLLAALSPTARAVVWLFEIEGCTHDEIAAAYGRSASFSKSQLARAHARLRALVEECGAAHESDRETRWTSRPGIC